MKELDLLKKSWNKEITPKVTTDEIYKMILKKSSSSVKWIFIISVIELLFGLISAIFISPKDYNELNLPNWIENFITFSSLFTVLVFSLMFYKNYKKINTSNSIKQLLNNIIKTRKTVKQFVVINLSLMALLMIIGLSYLLTSPIGINNEVIFELTQIKDYILLGLIIFFTTTISIGLLLVVYYIFYGFLMNRLNKNYKELKELDL